MCLIALALCSPHEQATLGLHTIVVANRDEAYARPTAPAHWWQPDLSAAQSNPNPWIFGGRDLIAAGSWLAVSTTGRWAAITNVREGIKPAASPNQASRGLLVSQALANQPLEAVSAHAGFNLLVGSPQGVTLSSNRGTLSPRIQQESLPTGIHAVSNGVMLNDWPKAQRLKAGVHKQMQLAGHQPLSISGREQFTAVLLGLLEAEEVAPDPDLPDTGVGLEMERRLSPILIRSEHYGTRVSTVLLITTQGEVWLTEQSRHGPATQRQARFRIQS